MSKYCDKCGAFKKDGDFYLSRRVDKYPPDGRMTTCKSCITMHVDCFNPETFKWILEEIDVPYVKEEWERIIKKNLDEGRKISNSGILGKYLAKMKLNQWQQYRWEDSEKLSEEYKERKINQLKIQGYSDEEIERELETSHIQKPDYMQPDYVSEPKVAADPQDSSFETEEDKHIMEQLTDDDVMALRLKWGSNYRPEEWVRMEQLYNDMMNSYDIQTAGHKDTLIMLCKTSLKANQLLDAGDIDGFQKMQKAYDSLMKSGKFTAAQNKEQQSEFIDSIGELVAICEKEGFIPRYYTDGPQDKVDRTLQDLQKYTHDLVTEETNLSQLAEQAFKKIEEDRLRESQIDVETEVTDSEDTLFSYDTPILTDDDYREYNDMIDAEQELDDNLLFGGEDDGTS